MYQLFYRLKDRPFGLEPNLKYFYLGRPFKRAIDALNRAFEQRGNVITLLGENGMGKTTLITYFLAQLDKKTNSVAYIPKPPEKLRDLLPAILKEWNIPITEHAPNALFSTLHNFLREQASRTKKVFLVIDNAESLSNNCFELIRLLAKLPESDRGLLQIVLVGTNQLEITLTTEANREFRKQVSLSYCLLPLHLSDTREYIEHRLKIAGWSGDPIIDDSAFNAIHELTGGVPSEINQCCDRLLTLGTLREAHRITDKDVTNLTPATLEKLEELEAKRMKQKSRDTFSDSIIDEPFASATSQPSKTASAQLATNGFDFDKFGFDMPTRNTKPAFNTQVKTIIAAAVLIGAAVLFWVNKNGPSTHGKVATGSHSVGKEDSAEESSVGHGEGGMEKYVLSEMSAEDNAVGDEKKFLDIQQLLTRSVQLDAGTKSDQTNDVAGDAANESRDNVGESLESVTATAHNE